MKDYRILDANMGFTKTDMGINGFIVEYHVKDTDELEYYLYCDISIKDETCCVYQTFDSIFDLLLEDTRTNDYYEILEELTVGYAENGKFLDFIISVPTEQKNLFAVLFYPYVLWKTKDKKQVLGSKFSSVEDFFNGIVGKLVSEIVVSNHVGCLTGYDGTKSFSSSCDAEENIINGHILECHMLVEDLRKESKMWHVDTE